jgi:hypothetical protein
MLRQVGHPEARQIRGVGEVGDQPAGPIEVRVGLQLPLDDRAELWDRWREDEEEEGERGGAE